MVAYASNPCAGEAETGSWGFVGQPSPASLNKMKYGTHGMILRVALWPPNAYVCFKPKCMHVYTQNGNPVM